ncbi:MAG: proline--tRNA ligase, partial [Conexivisphaerales archaeon]
MLRNKKEEDLPAWYIELVQAAGLMDYSAIRGFFVYRPYLYAMWEKYVNALNSELRKEGVENAYFPILIPESLLKKESEHVEGFTPEAAWVESAGNNKLEERYAVRPTSETIMYYSYSKWIHSYKDLPLRINQWNNMVRWETKETRFLLRQRENLWQEGHSVFSTAQEADSDARKMLEIYSKIIKDMFAIPFYAGRKSEAEKFAGAVTSYTLETFFENGYSSQIATSHFLGQNFSKPFDIKFLDENNQWKYAYQNSWGTSGRLHGAMIIIHSDNKGLVLPPKIAPIQFIIIPIIYDNSNDSDKCIELSKEVCEKIESFGFSAKVDADRDTTPGWKYNEYELKGIPFRISIGKDELVTKEISIKRRF